MQRTKGLSAPQQFERSAFPTPLPRHPPHHPHTPRIHSLTEDSSVRSWVGTQHYRMSSHPEGSSGSGTASGSGGSGRRLGRVIGELRKKVSNRFLRGRGQPAPTGPAATTQGSTQGSVPPRVSLSLPLGDTLDLGRITGPASLTQVDTVQTPALGETTSQHDPLQPPRTPESTSSQRTSDYDAHLTAENKKIARYEMDRQRPTSGAGPPGQQPSLRLNIPSITIPSITIPSITIASITTSPESLLPGSEGSAREWVTELSPRPRPGPSSTAVPQAPSDSLQAQSSGHVRPGIVSFIEPLHGHTEADPSAGDRGEGNE